jgi:hypothetical protein
VGNRLFSDSAIPLSPITRRGGSWRVPLLGVEESVPVDAEPIGEMPGRLTRSELLARPRDKLTVEEATQAVEERAPVAIATDGEAQLARRDQPMLVQESQDDLVVGLDSHIGHAPRRQPVLSILSPHPALRQRPSSVFGVCGDWKRGHIYTVYGGYFRAVKKSGRRRRDRRVPAVR